MIETKYICDYCGKESISDVELVDWFILGYYKVRCYHDIAIQVKPEWIKTHQFCSEECLNKAVLVKAK